MSTLIRQRGIERDDWRLVRSADEVAADGEDVIVPFAVWRADAEALRTRSGRTGLWLAGADDPAELAALPPWPALIAVQFAAFTDGRGYSIARLLRERHGYRGELRAIGDVQRDQLFELARCGFDAFALRADQDPAAALRAFADFSEVYQAAADRGPLFARRFSASPNQEHR